MNDAVVLRRKSQFLARGDDRDRKVVIDVRVDAGQSELNARDLRLIAPLKQSLPAAWSRLAG